MLVKSRQVLEEFRMVLSTALLQLVLYGFETSITVRYSSRGRPIDDLLLVFEHEVFNPFFLEFFALLTL